MLLAHMCCCNNRNRVECLFSSFQQNQQFRKVMGEFGSRRYKTLERATTGRLACHHSNPNSTCAYLSCPTDNMDTVINQIAEYLKKSAACGQSLERGHR
jgi:hypothetical protein